MVSFERIVRPVVFPDVTPTPQPVSSDDSDDRGVEITSGGGQIVSLSKSFSASASSNSMTEVSREYDVARIRNPEDSEQYVDVEVPYKFTTKDAKKNRGVFKVSRVQASSNVDILERGLRRNYVATT